MITGQESFVCGCSGKVLFGKRPQNYTGISGEIFEGEQGFVLRTYDENGEILPSADALCCAGKYLWDQGIRECPVTVKSGENGGEHLLLASTCGDKVTAVTAGVDQADFVPQNIPLRFEKSIINDTISLPDCKPFRLTVLRFQDPYGVVFLDTVGDCLILNRGKEISSMRLFPQGAEIVFAHTRGEKELHLRAWHRDGSTEIRGNDICAALAAAVAAGRCLPDTAVTVPLSEGDARAVCTKEWELFLTIPMSP